MQSRPPILLRSLRVFVRLGLGLVLLVGLCIVVAGVSLHAHAAADATLTVTDCSVETGPGRIGTVISSASPGDTITFSCSGTIPITSTLTITKNLTLNGSGQNVTLDGGNSTQVLSVNSGVTFNLKALTIAHGSAFGGGGISNSGTETISNSTFANNSANNGGGISNSGTVTISNSTFANNSTTTAHGGGISNGGTVTISNSTFANNSASGLGGGLINGSGASVSISNSTFSGNSSAQGGGGISNGGTVTISNSTFANNSAPSGSGGGLFNSSTISIGGSIVANNAGSNCTNIFSGTITSAGYNLESGTDCGFTGTGDLQNSDPKLGPLSSNGGPTQKMALLKGSPAIDYIPLSSGLCPTTDQRGHKRPDNPRESACDIGAYES